MDACIKVIKQLNIKARGISIVSVSPEFTMYSIVISENSYALFRCMEIADNNLTFVFFTLYFVSLC